MESFGVSDLLFFTEYTQSHGMAQHIMGLFHYWTSVSIPPEEQESLEGPCRSQVATIFTSSTGHMFSIQHSLPAGYGFPNYLGCIAVAFALR